MNFAIYNQAGAIEFTGMCPDDLVYNQCPPGMMVYKGDATMHDRIDVATGRLIKGEPPAPTYFQQRRDNYPGMLAQLEALWHAMDIGEIPKATEFYNMVADVKRRFPKPDDVAIQKRVY